MWANLPAMWSNCPKVFTKLHEHNLGINNETRQVYLITIIKLGFYVRFG